MVQVGCDINKGRHDGEKGVYAQMRSKYKNRRPPKSPTKENAMMVDKITELAQYEEFIKDIPAELRAALLEGRPADEIYKKYAHYAAVRVVQILATEKDSGKALQAAKELLDRVYGKATERKEVKHSLEDLPDQELDALLLSELGDDAD